MNHKYTHSAIAAALAVLLLATESDQGVKPPVREARSSGAARATPRSAWRMISRWPDEPRALAGLMIQKYGTPEVVVASQLSWSGRRPWAKIVVFRDPETSGGPAHLLETVAYGDIALGRWRELSEFGHGAAYDPVTQELSARTNGEETNTLALNLADEIIRGRRSASSARAFYDATLNLSLYGKSSPYMSGLLFEPRAGSAGSEGAAP